MTISTSRKSWDTNVKHYYRLGLEENLPTALRELVSNSNKSRWKSESENKYAGCDVAKFINQELELIKRINQSSKIKKINESYFKLADTLHEVISNSKGIKTVLKQNKELIVNTIEQVKNSIPIENALKIFNISRSTFENYKTIVIHKCEASYFKWCTQRFLNQLLPKEVKTIQNYMTHKDYQYWSKSSVYLKAVRDELLKCCVSTFYKYCRLLGFQVRKNKKKSDDYHPIKTSKPNELWCADVTLFKTADGIKHHIHFLIDHFSKMILGYCVEKSSSGKTIAELLQEATLKYKPVKLTFLTDGGSENVNETVSRFLNNLAIPTKHDIAQKDILFSNSMIEALNKTIKHQFLYPKQINSGNQLSKVLDESVILYNIIRPQRALGGNTPFETHNGILIDFSKYKASFIKQKGIRLAQNKAKYCKTCL